MLLNPRKPFRWVCVRRRLRLGALLSLAGKKNTFTDALNPAATTSSQQQHVEHQHKARRLRGGGAGRVRPGLPGPVHYHFPLPLCTVLPSFAPFTTPPLERPLIPFPIIPYRLLGPEADPVFSIYPIGLLHRFDRMFYLFWYASFFHFVNNGDN